MKTWAFRPDSDEWHHPRDVRCAIAQAIYSVAGLMGRVADRIDHPTRHGMSLAQYTIETHATVTDPRLP